MSDPVPMDSSFVMGVVELMRNYLGLKKKMILLKKNPKHSCNKWLLSL